MATGDKIMPKKRSDKIDPIKVISGVEYIYAGLFNDLCHCESMQYDYKLEGIKTRRYKTEEGNYKLYLRSEDND